MQHISAFAAILLSIIAVLTLIVLYSLFLLSSNLGSFCPSVGSCGSLVVLVCGVSCWTSMIAFGPLLHLPGGIDSA